MAALLPLLGGILLGRFQGRRQVVLGIEALLFALAAAVLIATAPDHDASYGKGVVLAAVLAPLCVLAVVLGQVWRRRAVVA